MEMEPLPANLNMVSGKRKGVFNLVLPRRRILITISCITENTCVMERNMGDIIQLMMIYFDQLVVFMKLLMTMVSCNSIDLNKYSCFQSYSTPSLLTHYTDSVCGRNLWLNSECNHVATKNYHFSKAGEVETHHKWTSLNKGWKLP